MKQYLGNYLGLCINNDDPEKRGRVQIFIPGVMPAIFENWLDVDEDIRILCVGDNLPDSIPAPVVEKLMKILPWAESASPILGESSPGNLINNAVQAVGGLIGSAVDAVGNYFNQSPVPVPIDGGTGGASIFSPTQAPTSADRSRIRSSGGIVINLDTNWSSTNSQTQPLVVIPDNATPAQRQAAQSYANAVASAYAARFGSSLPGKVLTRSQNGRGRDNTIHTEPYSVKDTKAAEYFTRTTEGRRILASITNSTLGRIPGAVFALPHGGVGGRDQGAVGSLGSEVDFARILLGDLFGGRRSNGSDGNNTGYESTSTSGQVSSPLPHQSSVPQSNASNPGSIANPTVNNTGPSGRSVTVDRFAANNDGNTTRDANLSSTYQNKTASGIPNDSEILGYTIPLDSSLARIASDSRGNPVARLRQPAIITFRTGSGQQYRVLAVGNDTGGRQVNNNPYKRDWGEFGTNTIRALQSQGMQVSLGRNRLGMPAGTTATYQFLDGTISSVEDYRKLRNQLIASGQLDPIKTPTPTSDNSAAVIEANGLPSQTMSQVNQTDQNGPTAVLNINNMAKGVFTYPSAGAVLWVFFREGNPLFPVYFAANYGQREWQSAYRYSVNSPADEVPGYKPSTKNGNPVVSTGTVANFGTGGWKTENTDNPKDPKKSQKSFMIFGHDGSNMFFNNGYHQLFSKFDRRDQVEGDRFNTTLGTKEDWVQSDSNQVVMGDQVIKVGDFSPETIEATRNIQSLVKRIMAPLARPKRRKRKKKRAPSPAAARFLRAAQQSYARAYPPGPYEVPMAVYLEEARAAFEEGRITPSPDEVLAKMQSLDFDENSVPITPPTPPEQTDSSQ